MNRVTWEIKQIIKELEAKQIKYDLLNNQKFYFELTNKKDLPKDYTIFLERSLSYFRGLYTSSILETKGYDTINNFNCLNITGNKLLTSLELIKQEIPTPKSGVAFKKDTAMDLIEEKFNYPAIIKPLIGSWGRLVAKLDDYNAAQSNLECRETMGDILQKIYYIQDFIKVKDKSKEGQTDLRVFVIDGECVAGMERYSPSDDFRSNIAIGGSAKPLPITPQIREICTQAAAAVDGEIVGVDLIDDGDSLKVIEINGTPQFRGISKASDVNIAEKIVEYIVDECESNKG
ncbi:MAG: RimK family alpha-L-glutamate ligase [Promethearchaeia archaeon]